MLRRIFFQVTLIAGCAALGLTLWRTLSSGQFDILQACLRAVGSGIAVLIVALLLYRFVERLAGHR